MTWKSTSGESKRGSGCSKQEINEVICLSTYSIKEALKEFEEL